MSKNKSLRMQITLIVAGIITLMSILLTSISIENAYENFTDPLVNKHYMNQEIISQNNQVVIGQNEQEPINEIQQLKVEVQATQAQKNFSRQSLIVMSILVILGILSTYFLVGSALKPLRNLGYQIKRIDENHLNESLVGYETISEIGALANAFNSMLNRLNKSFIQQKQFSAHVAHELKTPLTTLKTSIQVLEMEEKPSLEDYKENLEITKQNTQRLIKIVEDLLKLAQVNQIELNDTISIKSVIYQILEELKGEIQEKHLNIEYQIEEVFLKGNKVLLYRALFNLVENAIKYNKVQGNIQLMVRRKDEWIEILISDTGIGIPQQDLPYIFEPFYRVDKSRSRDIGGAGLGLAIVKTIIERHNGKIEVSCNKEEGTSIRVKLKNIDLFSDA